MSFWVALGTVVVCGIATGVVLRAAGTMLEAGSLTVNGQALLSTARPEDAGSALVQYVLLAALVEAVLVKLTVAALTGFTISLPRALAAGLVAGAAGLLPLAAVLARPENAGSGVIGADAGYWMLALPLSLAVVGLHALLVAGLSEPRASHDAWAAYSRTTGRG